jgi:hypothetical protein
MSTTKLTGRENLTNCTFWLGPVGPTDKENQVKMYKKYCIRYITHLKRQASGSVSNSRIRICIKFKSRIRICINVKIRIRSKRSGTATLISCVLVLDHFDLDLETFTLISLWPYLFASKLISLE